ncbi:MAG: medium chain dehydrogenase/reductase family protein [Deltaproteobacteria bacterium]|nr:medium chain dehydrogenase/reductase family protein [Deltaproteobacteria bacterium]
MRALTITRHGGPEVLEVREVETPTPGPGEVRVRLRFAGVNFSDIAARQGMYPDAPKPPCVVGYEGSGDIDAVGEGVDASRMGERVLVLTKFNGQAEYVCVPTAQAMVIDDAMTYEHAAALPVVYITAYHMLFRVAHLRPGMKVLVHMAAGGVGTAVLQLCSTVENVEVFGTASAGKHDAIRAQGCAHPIDYRSKDYAEEVRRITNGRGVDLVLDPLGGRDWKKGFELLAPAGMLIAFGFSNMTPGESRSIVNVVKQAVGIPLFTPLGLMDRNRAMAGVNIGHLWEEIEMLSAEAQELLELYRTGKIQPIVDAVIPLERAVEAHARLSGRQNVGKVLLSMR